MTVGAEKLKEDLVEAVAERVRGNLEPGRAEGPARFVQRFFANVAPADLLNETPDNLYGSALAIWHLAARRRPGRPKVRVYNPTLDEHGWRSRHTVVEIVTDDMAFLVDSVTAYLARHDAEVHLVIHPVLSVSRSGSGDLTVLHSQLNGDPSARRESYMHIQITEQSAEARDPLRHGLERVPADVRAAVEDWQPMCDRCHAVLDQLADDQENRQFLEWILDDHFTFLGYREYRFVDDRAEVLPESGLGVLRDELASVFDGLITGGRLPDEIGEAGRIRIVKANRRSTIHRPVHMDTIGVKTCDDQGRPSGEHLFIGLFTSAAYSESVRNIPILREKVSGTLARSGHDHDGHDHKKLEHILDTYPRDELWQIDEEQLFETASRILHLQERQRIALFMRIDAYERYASCLVYVPRDLYGTGLRLRFQEILASALNGEVRAFYTSVSEGPLARLHIILKTTPGDIPPFDENIVERRLVEAGRTWLDKLREAITQARGERDGLAALRQFGDAFPPAYSDVHNAADAVHDIERIEEALDTGDLAMNLYRPVAYDEHQARFKIYSCGRPAPLSVLLPMLEHLGFKVIGEVPFRLRPTGFTEPVWIRAVELETRDGEPFDLASVREAFHEAFSRVWRGEMENDGFNRLVLRAGLRPREVTILRAYCKFLRQARAPFSESYMQETLAASPHIARKLVQLFNVMFDPAGEDRRDERADRLRQSIESDLESVTNLDEDRILRRFLALLEATLRTNHFQRDAEGRFKGYLSLKLDSRAIPRLPKPRPLREVFVYSPRVEAVHLRGGMVARGGIRWSDRREDFRTEVLGLMKAQMVKNSVIVPVGSKGGFVVKQPPDDWPALKEEVVACYRTMMRGLLDLTDTLQGDLIVQPPHVVRRDGNDPYLVVAADKGTATFSDTANAVAKDYGFWLDDAFASGGSAGYDHKKMGITARGAWESVKRHFREAGKDIQGEDFTVAGVGDMSGDVFGNGMLLSRHIRLVAAFNHQHVFVDPDPDSAASFAERERLFALPGSTWKDYDESLISSGGGVFDRSAKSVRVSTEMRGLLGLETSSTTPNELVQAILKAPVELMWFGGIGTYVRASAESDEKVGDRANDPVRIDAREFAAKVVGEGANLALTQRARIEFAQLGGRINTDAIDNSAGVDCSDHEVNLKVLLGDVERNGDMTRKQRNQLLASMTDEVAALCLRDNYLQTQSITVTQNLGVHLLDRLARFMRGLEKEGRLDRDIEFLPDDDALAERLQRGQALTRPEIAVLLSYAKIVLNDELLLSDLPDDPCMVPELLSYFPKPLRERFPDGIKKHRLRREIVATVLTNDIVNRVGVTFVHEVKEKTGMPAEEVVRAYLVAREISGMAALWEEIEALDSIGAGGAQASLLTECGRLLERSTVWLLGNASHPIDVRSELEKYAEGARELAAILDDVLTVDSRAALEARAETLIERGAPRGLAQQVARLRKLEPTGDIVNIARAADVTIERAARSYFCVGHRFGFNWLRNAAALLPSDTAWDKLAVTVLVDDLYGHQADLTRTVLDDAGSETDPVDAIEEWAENRRAQVARAEQLLGELQSMSTVNLAMLAVASRQLKSMSG